jgi:ABC-type transport system involved in cytochrome c biogenesis permease subunit
MKGQHKYSRKRKRTVEVAIVGFVFATMFYNLDAAAQRCSLLDKAAWVALEVSCPLILAAWQSVPSHLCPASSLLQHVLQIVASIRPLLCVMVGYA